MNPVHIEILHIRFVILYYLKYYCNAVSRRRWSFLPPRKMCGSAPNSSLILVTLQYSCAKYLQHISNMVSVINVHLL